MKKFLRSLFLTTLLISGNALAQVSTENVIELLKATGLTSQIGKLPGQLKKGIAQQLTEEEKQGKAYSKEVVPLLNTATDNAVRSSEILLELAVAITKNMSESEVVEIMKWYRSDLGSFIAGEEASARAPETQAYIEKNTQNLLNQAQRADFGSNVAKLVNSTNTTILVREKVEAAMQAVVTWARNPDEDVNVTLLRSQISERLNKAPARSKIRQLIVASFVHAHRKIGLRDLIKYEMHLGSDALQKYNRLVVQSLGIGIEKAMDKWLKEVQKQLLQVEA